MQWWFWFDCLACLDIPGNRVNLLDYLHPFLYLSVSLHGSCQGLQQWSGIHFFMFCTQTRSGNPLCAAMFGRGEIHPSIHTCMHCAGTRHVFISIHLSSSAISPPLHLLKLLFFYESFQCSTDVLCSLDSPSLKHSTMWHLMTSSLPLVCVSMEEDTSQWTSPDHWTVKPMGTPACGDSAGGTWARAQG